MTICEAFKDEAFGKDILDTGIPKGKFPRNCPAKSVSSMNNIFFLIKSI